MRKNTLWNTLQTIGILSKIKVVIMMLFAALTGMLIAPKNAQNPLTMSIGLIGIALHAISSATLNQLFETDIDQRMQRTQSRPLPTQSISNRKAAVLALGSFTLGSLVLWIGTTATATYLSMLTTLGYAVIYTRILKPITSQNIVIGGLSGAMPPLLGWACLQPTIQVEPIVLVLIIFAWTPAHFWPLAIHNIKDYQRAALPMLPVTHGISFTTYSIMAYTLLTSSVSLLPYCIGLCSYYYLIAACILNSRFIYMAYQLHRTKNKPIAVFTYSILYLYCLFIAIICDHTLGSL